VRLTREQVQHIAELAKLGITDQEAELFAGQLSEILEYAQMLNRLDTDAIPPTAQAIYLRNVSRRDEVRPSLPPAEILGNAPQRQGNCFKVRLILDQ